MNLRTFSVKQSDAQQTCFHQSQGEWRGTSQGKSKQPTYRELVPRSTLERPKENPNKYQSITKIKLNKGEAFMVYILTFKGGPVNSSSVIFNNPLSKIK